MSTVVVTGAAGYIGGQIALQLHDAGHQVLGIDREPLPRHLESVMQFEQCCVASDQALMAMLKVSPQAVIHCAGTSLVGPSIKDPQDYYENNFVKSKRLIDFLLRALPRIRIIFSSSAAVYGEPIMTPCQEIDPAMPISPYGQSKLMIEWLLESYRQAYGLDYVAFRYFNACGADPQGRHGQAPGATHIIARVLESIRDGQEFTLYGNSYPTADGTCVRDYVHVNDIARAHVLALSSVVPSGIYNLGSNTGTSNSEIIAEAQKFTQQTLAVKVAEPRLGDPAQLTASDQKFAEVSSNWRQHTLSHMIEHAWTWYNQKRQLRKQNQ